MLMHLVISRRDVIVDFDLFISTEPMPEQSQVPTRKITAMVYPTIQEPESAVQIKSIYVGAPNRASDFAPQLGRDAFVGINDQHPFILPGNIFQRPVLLSWEISVPNKLHDASASCLGNRLGAIGARRINDYDFLRERNAGKTRAQVRGFILSRHKHR